MEIMNLTSNDPLKVSKDYVPKDPLTLTRIPAKSTIIRGQHPGTVTAVKLLLKPGQSIAHLLPTLQQYAESSHGVRLAEVHGQGVEDQTVLYYKAPNG